MQITKRLAKEKAFEFAESAKKLDSQLATQNQENIKLKEFIKALELQIAGEEGRLNGVKQAKKEDIEFAENAFYTSNEDGMGVSPNHFISQNRMPRPAHRERNAKTREALPSNEVSHE